MKKAATLIEMLAVITIIAALTSITLPVFVKATTGAKVTRSLAQMHQLGLAFTLYREQSDGGTTYGTGTEMGLPDIQDFYLRHKYLEIEDNKTMWNSPCGYSHNGTPIISYTYIVSNDEADLWPRYVQKYQDNSILLADFNCNPDNVIVSSPYFTKRYLGLRLNGSAFAKVTKADYLNFESWTD